MLAVRVLCVGNMYPPHHLGGYELVWRSAVGALRASGHQTRVLTTDYRLPGVDPDAASDPDVHRELRWYWRDHEFPRMSVRACLELERDNAAVLARQLDEFEPDVVSWWAMGGMSLSLIEQVRRAGVPAIGVVNDHWPVYGPKVDAWSRLASRPLVGPALRRIGPPPITLDAAGGRWLFVSEHVRQAALAAGWQVPDSEIAPSGVDLTLFAEAPKQPWRWRLLCAGRIDSRKGIDSAIAALPELPAQASLVVAGRGDDEYLGELRTLADRLGVGGQVSFTERPHRELASVYADSDAVLFPVQWAEPWGTVPLEGMAVGRPVVATGTGGSGEFLRDGENCLLFDRDGNGPALAQAVTRLADDPSLRARLRSGGLDTARHYDQRHFTDAVHAALEHTVGATA